MAEHPNPLPRREAARVIMVDEADRTLLIEGVDTTRPEGGSWWFTPGGGREGDETDEENALREVEEETGLRLGELHGPVFAREFDLIFLGTAMHQVETYFIARVRHFEPVRTGWTDVEREALLGIRWWSREELAATSATVYPENLYDLIDRYAPESPLT